MPEDPGDKNRPVLRPVFGTRKFGHTRAVDGQGVAHDVKPPLPFHGPMPASQYSGFITIPVASFGMKNVLFGGITSLVLPNSSSA